VGVVGVGIVVLATGPLRARRTAVDTTPAWRPQTKLLPAFEENADVPDVSPDGKSIAYQSDREEHGHWRVYIESLVDGTVRAVSTAKMPARAPRYTADGSALVVTSYDPPYQGAFLIPVAGGEPQLLDPLARAAAPCGDGFLLVRFGPYRIILRAKDGSERELAQFGEDRVRWPACDREGKRAVFTRLIGRPGQGLQDATDLWLMSMDSGELRRLTNDGLQNDAPIFHPDGRSVIFSSHRSGTYQIWELSLSGGAPAQLTLDDGPNLGVAVTPDGKQLVYNIDDTTMQVLAYRTSGQGAPHKVTSKLEDILSVDIDPDGKELVVTAQRDMARRVAILGADGTGDRTLARGDFPIFGNDGREVFYVDAGDPHRVLAVPRAGGTPREVTRAPNEVIALAAGEGERIHMTLKTETGASAWSVPASGGEATLEAKEPWTLIQPAPVGGWRIGVQPHAFRLIAPGMALDDPAAAEIHARELVWDRDGRSVVWFEANDLMRYSLETRERVKVFEAEETGTFAMAPDQKVAYVLSLAGHVHRALVVNYGDRPRPAP
jgi:Tol biopolymer transport system component